MKTTRLRSGVILAFWMIFVNSFSQQPDQETGNVIVVFKTHFDIGYTDLAGSVVKKSEGENATFTRPGNIRSGRFSLSGK